MSLIKKLAKLGRTIVDEVLLLPADKVADKVADQQRAKVVAKPQPEPEPIPARRKPTTAMPARPTKAPAPKVDPALQGLSVTHLSNRLTNLQWGEAPEKFVDALLATETPETAVALLKSFTIYRAHELESRRIVVHEWMDAYPELALAGLSAITDQLDAPGAEARDHVRRLARRYPDKYALFDERVPAYGWRPERRWLGKRPFAPDTSPSWLRDNLPPITKTPDFPIWLAPDNLPPLVSGDYYLSDEQVTILLELIRQSGLNTPKPLILALKENIVPEVLTDFVVHLLTQWNRYFDDWEQINWLTNILYWWHTPELPFRMIPVFVQIASRKRRWTEERFALKILKIWAGICDEASLQTLRWTDLFESLGKMRIPILEVLRQDPQRFGLDRSQFEDRLILTLGLDEQSRRSFAYRGQELLVEVNEDLTPRVRDFSGVWAYELPTAVTQDEILIAHEIVAYWEMLQANLPKLLEEQLWRLNRALIYERRWSWAEFSELFFRHPIMRHVARSIIWGRYRFNGEVTHAFVITEDGAALTADYDHVELPTYGHYGIIHPVDLTPKQRQAWHDLLLDYEIVTTFDQLFRPVYELTAVEEKQPYLTRFSEMALSDVENILSDLHWKPVGAYHTWRRWFPYSNVSALLTMQPKGNGRYQFEALRFAQGRIEVRQRANASYFWQLPLQWILPRRVRPRIISEVLWNWAQMVGQAERFEEMT